MSQISEQAGEVLQGTVPDGAIQGGAAATPAGGVGEGSPQAAGQQDELGFRIPKHVIPKEYGADWAAAFRDAKEYKAADAEGFSEIRRQAKARGITPGQLMQYIEQGLQPPPKAAAEAPPQRPAAGKQQVYDQFGQPVVLDPNDDPVLKAIAERDKKYTDLESKMNKLIADNEAREQRQTVAQTTQQYNEAKAKSDAAMDRAVREVFGIQSTPVKRNWLGRPDVEVDLPLRRAKNDIFDAVFEMRNQNGTASQMQLGGYPLPPTPEEVAFVASELKGDYQTADLEAAGRVADQRKHLPKGAPPRGSGGGPSRKAKPAATLDELREKQAALLPD
jgi:hypothetical protein